MAREKVNTTVLRTQGLVSSAQEKVVDKVSKTLDKVQTGLDNIGLKKLSPTHETDEIDRPPTPKFMQENPHLSFDDLLQEVKSTTSASSEDMSIATTATQEKPKKCDYNLDMEIVQQQVGFFSPQIMSSFIRKIDREHFYWLLEKTSYVLESFNKYK